MEIWNIERNEKWYESKWHGYSWEWDRMKLMNPRLQWTAILHLQGEYNVHVHTKENQIKVRTHRVLHFLHREMDVWPIIGMVVYCHVLG